MQAMATPEPKPFAATGNRPSRCYVDTSRTFSTLQRQVSRQIDRHTMAYSSHPSVGRSRTWHSASGELSTHPIDAIRVTHVPDQYAHLDEDIEERMNATMNLNSILSKALFDGTSA